MTPEQLDALICYRIEQAHDTKSMIMEKTSP